MMSALFFPHYSNPFPPGDQVTAQGNQVFCESCLKKRNQPSRGQCQCVIRLVKVLFEQF